MSVSLAVCICVHLYFGSAIMATHTKCYSFVHAKQGKLHKNSLKHTHTHTRRETHLLQHFVEKKKNKEEKNRKITQPWMGLKNKMGKYFIFSFSFSFSLIFFLFLFLFLFQLSSFLEDKQVIQRFSIIIIIIIIACFSTSCLHYFFYQRFLYDTLLLLLLCPKCCLIKLGRAGDAIHRKFYKMRTVYCMHNEGRF